jgi:hypothetical protein
MRITNELSNMRTTTMLMLAGFVILIVAAIAGRRRRAEAWADMEEEYEDELDEEYDLPDAVTEYVAVEPEDEEEDDDFLDEIELVD